jgi:hypothetical protein
MRRRPHRESDPQLYKLKVECLQEFETLAQKGLIDLYYGDESRVCLEPCAPYGWQFADEEVFMPSSKGPSLNCFALLSRDNRCVFETTPGYVNAKVMSMPSGWRHSWKKCPGKQGREATSAW